MSPHVTVNLHCEVLLSVLNIYIYLIVFLTRIFFGTFAFAFAVVAQFFVELHLTQSVSNNQVFSSSTPLVIVSRTKICVNVHLLLTQTLSPLDPLRQICTYLPSTVILGGWGAPSGYLMHFKCGILSTIKIPLSL